MNPRSKSVWMAPAACGASVPAGMVQQRTSGSPAVKNCVCFLLLWGFCLVLCGMWGVCR